MTTERMRILGVGNARSVHMRRWAKLLAARGHEVHVLSDRMPDGSGQAGGVTFHSFAEQGASMRIRGVRRFLFPREVSGVAGRLEVDLVHAHYLLPYGDWAARAAVHPLVVSPWGTDVLVHGRERRRGRRRARRALAAADRVVVNSRALARASVELGADPAHVEHVFWHLDLGAFGPDRADRRLRAGLNWPKDALIVLSLRGFRPDMNPAVLVQAFGRVVAEEPRARLLLANRTGPLREETRGLAHELGLDGYVAFHAVPTEELPPLVAACDVAVTLSESDSTPPSLLESMASGLPVVTTPAASVDEWVKAGEGAEVVPYQDEEATAGAILRLLRDQRLRALYGAAQRARRGERVADPGPELERVYREVLAG